MPPGTLKRKIKGGVTVDIMGVDAFLPGSQIALRRVPNVDDRCVFTPVGSPAQVNGAPMGDFTDDCGVDLSDYPSFRNCISFGGPEVPAGGCVDFFDFDRDADVDLRDYAGFQRVIGISHP